MLHFVKIKSREHIIESYSDNISKSITLNA